MILVAGVGCYIWESGFVKSDYSDADNESQLSRPARFSGDFSELTGVRRTIRLH